MAGDSKQLYLRPADPFTRIDPKLNQVVPWSLPSVKISCKSVQPFSRNLADKETNKETKKSLENNTPSRYSGGGVTILSKHYVVCCLQVACTSWLKTLARAAGSGNITDPMFVHGSRLDKYVRPFHRFTPQEREEIMRTHFKFMFVRHPFERLISAYRDKMLKPQNSG